MISLISSAIRFFVSAIRAGLPAVCLLAMTPTGSSAQTAVPPLVAQDVGEIGAEAEQIGQALARFAQGDPDGARQPLAAAYQANNRLPPPDILMARLYGAVNDLDHVRKSLERAVTEAPQDPEASISLGELAFSQNRDAEAEPLFAKGLELCKTYTANPVRQRVLRVRGLAGTAAVYERGGRWDDAEQAIAKWIEIDPQNSQAHTRLGRVQFEQGKYKEAYATFTELYERDDSVPRPEVNMALLYEQASQQPGREELHANAEKLMKLAVERVPNDLETRLAAAQWGLEFGRLDLAKSNAEAALKIDPDSLPAQMAVGVVARNEGDLDLAEDLFEQAHLESPANFAAMNNLALTLIERSDAEDHRRSLEFSQVNARLYPDLRQATGREAAVTLAWVLHQLGRQAEAASRLNQAGRAGKLTPESTYYAARILATGGNRDGARQLLEGILKGRHRFPHRSDAQKLLQELRD
jgi:tetratricopeptide (TPR) repeat protein